MRSFLVCFPDNILTEGPVNFGGIVSIRYLLIINRYVVRNGSGVIRQILLTLL